MSKTKLETGGGGSGRKMQPSSRRRQKCPETMNPQSVTNAPERSKWEHRVPYLRLLGLTFLSLSTRGLHFSSDADSIYLLHFLGNPQYAQIIHKTVLE